MPKLDEEDFVDPGNLPAIAQSKSGPPPATTANPGFAQAPATGFGGFGSTPMANAQPMASSNNTSAQAAGAMHQGGETTVALDKSAEDWINKKWRPVMGWVYMLTCTMDFVIFPILWSLLQALSKGSVTSQWQPLTLQGAGLYHIAMGAVLGIAAYGRTKEKVEGKN
jgi:hypothetical protein